MAKSTVKKGKITHTPCRVKAGYEIGSGRNKKHGGQFINSELCKGKRSAAVVKKGKIDYTPCRKKKGTAKGGTFVKKSACGR